ncbi:hypothetical protein GGS20DRAFT_530546 [Poronia punctata]|nr:hypothetical protein GGS20DRAFT_530546 [Poronia punctata]
MSPKPETTTSLIRSIIYFVLTALILLSSTTTTTIFPRPANFNPTTPSHHPQQSINVKIRTYYDILNTTSEASPSEIRHAYKKMVLLHHPDKARQQQSSTLTPGGSTFDLITQAYQTLSSPQKCEYDYRVLGSSYDRWRKCTDEWKLRLRADLVWGIESSLREKEEEKEVEWEVYEEKMRKCRQGVGGCVGAFLKNGKRWVWLERFVCRWYLWVREYII